ncbi:MAG: FAD-binding oxidoreductase [Solirubrobacterales bacterium]
MKHDPHGYWLEEAPRAEPVPALSGFVQADVLVVGGGYTGMWTAWHALAAEPGARVALVEADRCGHGPSGRNGGFVNSLWLSFENLSRRFGERSALEIGRVSAESVDEIGRFCSEQGVDAWYRKSGYMQVSGAPAQDAALAAIASSVARAGGDDLVTLLDPGQVARRCSSPRFRGGALFADAATVQPARLALGLRARLLEAGVAIFERSPVRALTETSAGVEARTEHGTVSAPRAVLAFGGAAARSGSPFRNALTVTSSHMVVTEPVGDLLEEIGWTGGEAISDSRDLVHYLRTTEDGRIAFGWGGGRLAVGGRLGGVAELDPEVVSQVAASIRRFFPSLERRRLTNAWGGPIDVSPTHLPAVVSTPGGRAWAAFGYTGNGVGPSQMLGRTLASLALDRRDRHSRLGFVDPPHSAVPPEPFRYAGGTAIRAGLLRKERAEEEGRRPSATSRALSAVPELIGFHIGR